MSWATTASKGGAWSVGGVASDAAVPCFATGNTSGTGGKLGGGEAVVRFQPGPIFTDVWAPSNWLNLDQGDTDVGGSGQCSWICREQHHLLWVLALGKDGKRIFIGSQQPRWRFRYAGSAITCF
jgi:hypothetical protein